jgi:hypothetical protein
LVAAIWAGSRGFHEFDSALIGYAVAIVALTFAVVSRYARWLRMPSTRRYWRRGWELAGSWRAFVRFPTLLPRATVGQLVGQGFIRRRGVVRWLGHQCLFWGVIIATLITFPLVFGWLAFRLAPGTTNHYTMWVFGFSTFSFPTNTFLGWSLFHALDYTAALVIIGCAVFLWRRFRDRAVTYRQQLGYDLLPLLMLLTIAVTGLLLTFSASLLNGSFYDVFMVVHMASVVLALVFIPFGKFFHVLQRPASVGIQLYTEVNSLGGSQACAECGEPLAPAMFIDDLEKTLSELGQDYRLPAVAADHALPPAASRPDAPGPAIPLSAPRLADGERPAPSPLLELCPRCRRVARARAFFAANGKALAR